MKRTEEESGLNVSEDNQVKPNSGLPVHREEL